MAILTVFVLTGCGGPEPAEKNQASAKAPAILVPLDAGIKTVKTEVATPDAAVALAPTHAPAGEASGTAKNTRIKTLASGVFYRESSNRLPPWDSVEVTNVFGFMERPKKSALTILPIDVTYAPFDLKVVSFTQRKETTPYWWEVELEKVTDKQLHTIPMRLGRVAVLYPAQSDAKLLSPASIPIADLPKGMAPVTVMFAVDSNGDDRPDAIEQSFCCDNESESGDSGNCDYNCSKTYLRQRGKWKMVNSSQPE